MKNLFWASVSTIPRAPFIRVIVCSTRWRRSAMIRSASSRSRPVRIGVGCPHANDEADLTCLERARYDVFQDLDQLALRNLSLDIHAKAAVDVSLGGHHLPLTPFVLADDFRLVRNHDLGIHDDREIQGKKLSKKSGIGGIRRLLQADKRVQQAADFQILIRLRFDADVRQPASDALVLVPVVIPAIRKSAAIQRVQRCLDQKEQFVVMRVVE